VRQILLDLDGVLADFALGVCRLCGRDGPNADDLGRAVHEVAGITQGDMWRRIDQAGAKFWRELPATPWADELVKLCRAHGDVVIATAPSQDPAAAAGKLAWIQRRFGRRCRDYAITPRKDLLAAPGRLLVDDAARHVEDFTAAGGQAVLVPTWANGALREGVDVLATVAEALRRMEGTHDGE